MEINKNEVGARIAQARREAGLSQTQLADILGTHPRTVAHYEGAERRPFENIRAIAEALGKSVEWLLYGINTDERLRRLEDALRLDDDTGRLGRALKREEGNTPARPAGDQARDGTETSEEAG